MTTNTMDVITAIIPAIILMFLFVGSTIIISTLLEIARYLREMRKDLDEIKDTAKVVGSVIETSPIYEPYVRVTRKN